MRSSAARLIAGVVLALLLGLLLGCTKDQGDEQVIKQKLEQLEEAVEDKDASGIAGFMAEDFSGPSGMDRERAEAFARVMMARHTELGVTWDLKSLDIQGDRATVELTAILTGRALVPGFDGRGRLMNVQMGWRRSDGEWWLVHANWSGTFEKSRP